MLVIQTAAQTVNVTSGAGVVRWTASTRRPRPHALNSLRPPSRRYVPRIVYISNGNVPSKWAHTFHVVKMTEALSRNGHSVTLLTGRGIFRDAPRRTDLESWYGVERNFRVWRLPAVRRMKSPSIGGAKTAIYRRCAAAAVRLIRPHLVITRDKDIADTLVRRGFDTLVELHTPVAEASIETLVAMQRLPAFGGLVTVTEELRSQYVRAGMDPGRILVLPDGVDLRRFEGGQGDRLERLSDRPTVVYTGHLYEMKGVDTLRDAARLTPRCDFRFVGGWPDDVERMRAESVGLDNVRWDGFVGNSELAAIQKAADILALPNSGRFAHARETSPLKLFEYLAAGRPIIATDVPAFRSVLRHGRNAHLVPPDDAVAMAAGIDRLLTDRVYAESLAEAARRDARGYSWEKRAKSLVAFASRSDSESQPTWA